MFRTLHEKACLGRVVCVLIALLGLALIRAGLADGAKVAADQRRAAVVQVALGPVE